MFLRVSVRLENDETDAVEALGELQSAMETGRRFSSTLPKAGGAPAGEWQNTGRGLRFNGSANAAVLRAGATSSLWG